MKANVKYILLTIVIDTIDKAHPNLSMVICHQDNVKQLLTLWVELPQPRIYCHQSLSGYNLHKDYKTMMELVVCKG